MKPKMKKNPNFRRGGGGGGGDGDDSSGIGFDKKNAHRRERRVFNPGNIKRYYKELVEPNLKEEEKEDLEYEQRERDAAERSTDDYDSK